MNALLMGDGSDVAQACAERLREDGMTVVLTTADRSVQDAAELGRSGLDVLVTCPELRVDGSIEGTPEAVFRELLAVNLSAVFKTGRESFAAMRKQGRGSMIHIASDAGIRAAHEMAAFSVMSAGVIALAELFAAEGAAHGIRSNAVCPRSDTDIAAVVSWLASEESAHLSGATLRVDAAAGAAMVLDTRV
ncbi:MAG: SDR family NAD(P)-dependent oxidoreductase [Solirubrobacteraceae bacterium]